MDIRKYQLFADIAETKSLRKTCERLHYSQSGASHIIKNMETDLGFPLFLRTKNGMELTDSGRLMLPAVHELLHCQERITQIICEVNNSQRGTVIVGAYSSIAGAWLPSILRDFYRDYPLVSVQIKEGNNEELEAMLEDGSVEFAFLSYRDQTHFRWFPMQKDEMMAVIPKSDPFSALSEFPVEYFQQRPFIRPEGIGTDFSLRAFHFEMSSLDPTLSVMDDYAIISLVRSGLGLSILPQLVLRELGRDEVAMITLKPSYHRELGIAMMPSYRLTPAARKLMDYAFERFTDPSLLAANVPSKNA